MGLEEFVRVQRRPVWIGSFRGLATRPYRRSLGFACTFRTSLPLATSWLRSRLAILHRTRKNPSFVGLIDSYILRSAGDGGLGLGT